jgi:hypothetical protein
MTFAKAKLHSRITNPNPKPTTVAGVFTAELDKVLADIEKTPPYAECAKCKCPRCPHRGKP